MAPRQDSTPPAAGRTQRPDPVPNLRPMWWVFGVGLALGIAGVLGVLFVAISPGPFGSWSWRVGLVLVALSIFILMAIPGTLLALNRRRRLGYRLGPEPRLAHPRFFGLAVLWAGLVTSGMLVVGTLFPLPFSHDQAVVYALAVSLVAFAPLLAILRFDRRR